MTLRAIHALQVILAGCHGSCRRRYLAGATIHNIARNTLPCISVSLGLPPVLAERLFVGSGHEMGLKLATMKDGSPVIAVPVASDVIDFLLSNDIDALLIDPFISCHSVKENDNDAMDTVVKEWGRIAGAANCAIGLVSHTRKPMNGSARENTTAVLT
jgi:hypothetical protein